VRVIEALIEGGQANTPTGALVDTPAIHDAHWLANTAPIVAMVAAFAVVLGVYLVHACSTNLAVSAAVLNIFVPYFLIPGFGVIVIAIARVIAREKEARLVPSTGRPVPPVPAT
jgi:hypothetical protein